MSTRKQFIILNALAITIYIFCWIWLEFELSDRAMFLSVDSQSYLEISEWMFKGGETSSTIIRPLMYPVLVGLSYLTFGVTGIWILQFVCWLVTVNLTFLSAKKWSKNQAVGWVAAAVILMNLSFIALTFHGLTEVVTTALLSVLCYHVISYSAKLSEARFGEKLLFIFVLLTLVKPLFYYPTLLCLVFILFAYRKHYRFAPKKLIYPLLIMIPILLQMTFVQVRYGHFAVSKIGGVTFTNYYFAKCVRNIEKIEDNLESVAFVNDMSSDERVNYMLENKRVFVSQFVENIVLNIDSSPVFLNTAYVKKSNSGYAFMQHYNYLSFYVHFSGTVLLFLSFVIAFFRREKRIWIPLLCIGGLSSYYVFTSGLSFWQGDRLLLPSIALWVPLYAVLFFSLGSKSVMILKKRRNQH